MRNYIQVHLRTFKLIFSFRLALSFLIVPGVFFPCWVFHRSSLCLVITVYSYKPCLSPFDTSQIFSLHFVILPLHTLMIPNIPFRNLFQLVFPCSEFPTMSSLHYIISTVFITYIRLTFCPFYFSSFVLLSHFVALFFFFFFLKLRQMWSRCPSL